MAHSDEGFPLGKRTGLMLIFGGCVTGIDDDDDEGLVSLIRERDARLP